MYVGLYNQFSIISIWFNEISQLFYLYFFLSTIVSRRLAIETSKGGVLILRLQID